MHRSVRASRLNTANCRSIYRSLVSPPRSDRVAYSNLLSPPSPRIATIRLRRIDVCCIREIFSGARIASKLDTRVLFHYNPVKTRLRQCIRIALTLTDCRAPRSPSPPSSSLSFSLSLAREEFKWQHLHTRKRKHPT